MRFIKLLNPKAWTKNPADIDNIRTAAIAPKSRQGLGIPIARMSLTSPAISWRKPATLTNEPDDLLVPESDPAVALCQVIVLR